MKINNPAPALFTTLTDATALRAINGTVYQNTSKNPKMVHITMSMNTNGDNYAQFYIDSISNPGSLVSEWGGNVLLGAQSYGTASFVVPGLWYYRGTQTGTISFIGWVEIV